MINAGASAEVRMASAIDIDGDLTISAGELSTNGNQLNVAGNLTITAAASAQFNASTGEVVLDGTNQTVTGDFNDSRSKPSAFYSFTKEVTAADTLTFDIGAEYEFNGTLTLRGASGQLLSLRSKTPSTQVDFRPDGSRDIDYIDVQDNNNVSGTTVDLSAANEAVNSGNNTDWAFGPPSVSGVSISTTSGSGVTTDDLTLNYALDNTDNAIFNWELNGNSITTLNLPFEANGGSEASLTEDFSGNGYSSSAVTATWSNLAGRGGSGAYDYDGAGDYVTMTNSVGMFPSTGFSVEMWVNIEDTSSYQSLLSRWDSASNERAIRVNFNNGVTCGAGTIEFGISADPNGTNSGIFCSNSVIASGWHHIVVNYDPSTEMSIYWDGSDVSDSFFSGSVPASMNNSDRDLAIGADYTFSTTPDSAYFEGQIDNFRIYDRVLSSDQIASLYNDEFEVIKAAETNSGDSWVGCVTPANDSDTFTEVCSAAQMIMQSPVEVPEFDFYVYAATLIGGFGYFRWWRRENALVESD